MNEDIYSPTMGSTLPTENPTEEKGIFGRLGAEAVDFIQTLVVFGAIFAIIYLFVAQPHKVSGSSMVPNFQNGDYILTDKITYRFSQPKGGDVIVLKNPRDESQDFIKRIMATPGQTIKVEGNHVFVQGMQLDENYLLPETLTRSGAFLHEGEVITAAPDQFFVFGDNRSHSSDSREWGAVTKEEIVGRVVFRYWPPSAVGLIKPSTKSANFSN